MLNYIGLVDGVEEGMESHLDGLIQDCGNSSVLAVELLQSCAKPWMGFINGVRHSSGTWSNIVLLV